MARSQWPDVTVRYTLVYSGRATARRDIDTDIDTRCSRPHRRVGPASHLLESAMRRFVSFVPLLMIAGSLSAVLAACASSGTPSPDEHSPTDRIVVTDPNGRVIRTTDSY